MQRMQRIARQSVQTRVAAARLLSLGDEAGLYGADGGEGHVAERAQRDDRE